MFVCAQLVWWSGVHVASPLTQFSAVYGYGGIAGEKDVLVPVPCKALRDAFPHQYNIDK